MTYWWLYDKKRICFGKDESCQGQHLICTAHDLQLSIPQHQLAPWLNAPYQHGRRRPEETTYWWLYDKKRICFGKDESCQGQHLICTAHDLQLSIPQHQLAPWLNDPDQHGRKTPEEMTYRWLDKKRSRVFRNNEFCEGQHLIRTAHDLQLSIPQNQSAPCLTKISIYNVS
jgi:hypothetical protein